MKKLLKKRKKTREINDRLVQYLLSKMLDGTISSDPDDEQVMLRDDYGDYFDGVYEIFPDGRNTHWAPEMRKAAELFNQLPLNQALTETHDSGKEPS